MKTSGYEMLIGSLTRSEQKMAISYQIDDCWGPWSPGPGQANQAFGFMIRCTSSAFAFPGKKLTNGDAPGFFSLMFPPNDYLIPSFC